MIFEVVPERIDVTGFLRRAADTLRGFRSIFGARWCFGLCVRSVAMPERGDSLARSVAAADARLVRGIARRSAGGRLPRFRLAPAVPERGDVFGLRLATFRAGVFYFSVVNTSSFTDNLAAVPSMTCCFCQRCAAFGTRLRSRTRCRSARRMARSGDLLVCCVITT